MAEPAQGHLARGLGTTDCMLLVIGNMIGTGIFLTTGSVAQALPSPTLILAAWLIGGVFALAGALTYAEMGAAFPRAGGHYAYIREAYGPLCGFLDGWVSFVAAFPCSIAFMAMGLATYLSYFFPFFSDSHILARLPVAGAELTFHGGHIPALATVIILTALNSRGLRLGKNAQNTLTVLKIVSLAGLALLGLFSAHGEWGRLAAPDIPVPENLLPAMAGALIGVSFAYLGWDAATYMAAEIREPQRVLPRALVVGAAVTAVLYLLFNVALLRMVPLEGISGSANVAQAAAMATLGPAGAAIISAVIVICILGAMNATIMTGPRVGYAMARDGLFFQGLCRIHPRFQAPTTAIIVQGAWTCVILLTGTFGSILTAAVFAMVTLSTATAAAIFVLRINRWDTPRPYHTWGYPFVPLIYCLGSLGILVNVLVQSPSRSLWSLGLLALGIPVYAFWSRRSPPDDSAT